MPTFIDYNIADRIDRTPTTHKMSVEGDPTLGGTLDNGVELMGVVLEGNEMGAAQQAPGPSTRRPTCRRAEKSVPYQAKPAHE